MDDLESLLENLRVAGKTMDDYRCFLCSCDLGVDENTPEHVIPAWAQRRYNLWNQNLTLLNGTSFPYRSLTVPCCRDCNSNKLKPLEDTISRAINDGAKAVRNLDKGQLYLWLGKIFFGLLFRELTLLLERSAPEMGTIVTPELIDHFHSHRLFMQCARQVLEFHEGPPASIFVFECQASKDQEQNWDLCDDINSLFIGVRMGRVGLVGVLQDGGAQEAVNFGYDKFYDLPLHPIQFREMCAKVLYNSKLATRTPKFVTVGGDPHQVMQLPLMGFSSKPLFEGGNPSDYARLLSFYTGQPYEKIFRPPQEVWTSLIDPSGELNFIKFD